MIVLLGNQQKDDEKQKGYCETEFDKAADEEAAAKTKLSETDAKLSELTDTIGTLMEEISTLEAGIAALDKSTADATEQRKEEHASYVAQMQMNEAAMGLVEKAKNRMQKFYNPTLYKAPPKTEMTMEEKIIAAGTFAQVHLHKSAVAPPPAPETFGAYEKSSEKTTGVLALMDMITKELEGDMKDAEYEEKTAQKDYQDLMADSAESREKKVKGITDKETAKAELSDKKLKATEKEKADFADVDSIHKYVGHLHTDCDFIMENFDVRKEARAQEVESLKNAKAVLQGAHM